MSSWPKEAEVGDEREEISHRANCPECSLEIQAESATMLGADY